MSQREKRLNLRITQEENIFFTQAATQQDQDISTWARNALLQAAQTQIRGDRDEAGFAATLPERTLLRLQFILYQILTKEIAREDLQTYADRATQEITRLEQEGAAH